MSYYRVKQLYKVKSLMVLHHGKCILENFAFCV